MQCIYFPEFPSQKLSMSIQEYAYIFYHLAYTVTVNITQAQNVKP